MLHVNNSQPEDCGTHIPTHPQRFTALTCHFSASEEYFRLVRFSPAKPDTGCNPERWGYMRCDSLCQTVSHPTVICQLFHQHSFCSKVFFFPERMSKCACVWHEPIFVVNLCHNLGVCERYLFFYMVKVLFGANFTWFLFQKYQWTNVEIQSWL